MSVTRVVSIRLEHEPNRPLVCEVTVARDGDTYVDRLRAAHLPSSADLPDDVRQALAAWLEAAG